MQIKTPNIDLNNILVNSTENTQNQDSASANGGNDTYSEESSDKSNKHIVYAESYKNCYSSINFKSELMIYLIAV